MELRNLSAKNFGAKCVSKVWDIVRSNFDTSDDEMAVKVCKVIFKLKLSRVSLFLPTSFCDCDCQEIIGLGQSKKWLEFGELFGW